MQEDLKIQGERFSIHLRGSSQQDDDNWGGYGGSHNYTTYWWAGVGKIIDQRSGTQQSFEFSTTTKEHGQVTLRAAILSFSSDGTWLFNRIVKDPVVVNETKLADMLGEEITRKIDEYQGDAPLPSVGLGPRLVENMVQAGVIADPETKQISLSI